MAHQRSKVIRVGWNDRRDGRSLACLSPHGLNLPLEVGNLLLVGLLCSCMLSFQLGELSPDCADFCEVHFGWWGSALASCSQSALNDTYHVRQTRGCRVSACLPAMRPPRTLLLRSRAARSVFPPLQDQLQVQVVLLHAAVVLLQLLALLLLLLLLRLLPAGCHCQRLQVPAQDGGGSSCRVGQATRCDAVSALSWLSSCLLSSL